MGQRISYFKNNFDKGLKDLLFDNYSTFRLWYLDYDKSSIDEFNEQLGRKNIKSYFIQNRDLKSDFSNLNKQLIDELVSEFIGTYFDLTNQQNSILEFFGPTVSKSRYAESSIMVSQTNDKEFITLWSYLTKGRSTTDNLHFDSFTNDYKVGFINRQEYLTLKNKIEFHFGDIETIKKKYWTNEERVQFEKAVQSGSYSLPGHNPKSSGLEYVLSALNELTEINKELITGIE